MPRAAALSRRLRPRVRAVLFACAALAACAVPAATQRAEPAWSARLASDSLAAIALIDRHQPDSAGALVARHVAAARRAGDPVLIARALLLQATIDMRRSLPADALARALEAIRLARAHGDSSVWMSGLRIEAMARNAGGDFAAGGALARQWLAIAERRGDGLYVGLAHAMLGWLAHQQGDLGAAARELERAVDVLDAVGHPQALAFALNALGNVRLAAGDYGGGRELYRRVLEVTARSGDQVARLRATNNLGVVEGTIGDLSRALALYREVADTQRARGEVLDLVVALGNIVNTSLQLGRVDEGLATAREAVELAERHGIALELPWAREGLASALFHAGRAEAAKPVWRSLLAAGDSIAPGPRAVAALGLAGALASQDSVSAALAVASSADRTLAPLAEQDVSARLRIQHAHLLGRAGRHAEALRLAEPLARTLEATDQLELALAAWTEVVRAVRRLGDAGPARVALERATAVWERGRRRTADPEFRELRGEQARVLALESVALHLAPGGAPAAAAAFDGLQRFKTRTLLERMAGPEAFTARAEWPPRPWPGVASFQHSSLAAGEALIEYATGADTSVVFVVTREAVTAHPLAGERRLAPLVELVRGVLGTRPRDGAGDGGAALERLATELLDPIADRVAGATSIVVAPDGVLHGVPFPSLFAIGAQAPARPVTVAPSASVLAALRARKPDAARGILAAALGAGPAGGEGRMRSGGVTLPGAIREARMLAARYRDVDRLEADRTGSLGRPSLRLEYYAILHFAGHTRADDQLPWLSGIPLRAGASGDSLLTAREIAGRDLSVRLVVLSSCESARGRARAGEGVAGLASAFLAAGAPTVVATLWPIDDRATETVMRAFYAELARGRVVADALAQAQAAVRANPRTRHPFYWAGFVVIGEGGTRPPLRRRASATMPVAAALAVTVIGVGLAARRRRRMREAR